MIEVKKYIELSPQLKDQLSAYVNDEFGHISIVKETEWALPDWTIIHYIDDQIATFYNILERNILIDDQVYKAGGLNNVLTPKEFRGKGYSSGLLKVTQSMIFEELNRDLGLLLCADALIPFYEKLGWYKIECPVYFTQSTGQKLWGANAMLLSQDKKLNPKKMNLNGLPW